MGKVFDLNVLLLYLVYGLSFYTMGAAIALQYRTYSSFRMANSLSLLAAFALLHGFSEWGSVFIPVKVPDFGDFPLWKLVAIQRLMQSVSYFFLFLFGVKLVSESKNQNLHWWAIFPTSVLLGWLVYFSLFIPLVGTDRVIEWLLRTEYWSRYLLAFPAGCLTAYGLYLQIPELQKINDRSVLRNLKLAAAAFGLFALFSGLVVPYRIGWLSSILNADFFREVFGVPIELFRTAAAVLATWAITRLLIVFDLEKQRQITEVRRLEAVYRERERFARDLHDDVIQNIFGIGLELQTTVPLLKSDPAKASYQINSAVTQINNVIHTLRAYIHGLEAKASKQDLAAVLGQMVKDFRRKSGLDIELKAEPSALSQALSGRNDRQKHLQQIVREALSNVVRHAKASRALVRISAESELLVVTVEDNGQGLPTEDNFSIRPPGKGLGLRNIRSRADLLGGRLEIFSRPGEGTKLVISVPLDGVPLGERKVTGNPI